MGIELDVLVGHPEHDLLFVATQVARVAGLGNPASSVSEYRRINKAGTTIGALIQDSCISGLIVPDDEKGRKFRTTTVMFSESVVYAMLLKGTAPQSEPFRKWVTEEVLPTIRKTGKYDAAESKDPIAVGIMDELKALRGEVVELKEIIRELVARPQQGALDLPAPKSPYEGDRKSTPPA